MNQGMEKERYLLLLFIFCIKYFVFNLHMTIAENFNEKI